MAEHYLDNSATTAVSTAAAQKAVELMCENFANPSSLHSLGFKAAKELEAARSKVAGLLGAEPSELCFTSGGTEANNLAILGTAEALRRRGNRIVTTATEHSSVHDTMLHLQKEGFDVVFISPDEQGHISPKEVTDAVNSKTILVSIMLVNNETGAINPVREIFSAIKRKNPDTVLHTDAVQALGKLEIKAKKLFADLITVSGHKVHAPKGVGALFVRKGVRLIPRTFGGSQEKKLRTGTEAAPLICAFGTACEEIDIAKSTRTAKELNTYLREKLSQMPDIIINSPEDASPFVLNFSVKGIRSETMLHHLASTGVYVSSGSACSKGAKSHVLKSMGLADDVIDSAIRVSFSKHNTQSDCDALLEGLAAGINTLAKR
ncbi:MAG: cysteine desulfurase [Ruminococcus sp.]|nr:cysteine desulfurase [Ruminococcus sp.]